MTVLISVYGAPKVGKSYICANFVKKFGGYHVDFLAVDQLKLQTKGVPEYHTRAHGDARFAVKKVGLSDDQYISIKNIEQLIKIADMPSADGPKKFVVLDDSSNFRWQSALNRMITEKHAMITKDDWMHATSLMKSIIMRLLNNYNVVVIHQMGDEYVEDRATGKQTPKFFPTGIEYNSDLVGEIRVERGDAISQIFEIVAARAMWYGSENFNPVIRGPTVEEILKRSGFDETDLM